MDRITYRAIITYDMPSGDEKGKPIVEFSIDELVDEIIKAGDGWTINHAHKCYPPYKYNKKTKQYDFKKVVSVTDDVRIDVQLKRLKKEEI